MCWRAQKEEENKIIIILSRTDGKRPDGLTLVPWQRGKSVTWNVTVTDTVADSYLHLISAKAGGAAENAAIRKDDKYVDLQQTYTFVSLAFETLGLINVKGVEFLQELSRRLAAISEDNRQTSFLFQRISVSLQRCTLSRSLTHLRKLLS